MQDRSTLFIVLALAGVLALYLIARKQKPQRIPPRTNPKQRVAVKPGVRKPTVSRGKPAIRRGKPTTRPARLSAVSFQQRFQALRKRVLDPTAGLIYKKKLLPVAKVQQLLGIKEALEPVFLQGIPRSRRYDATQYVLKSKPTANQYILGLQVWLGKPQGLQGRFRRQMQTYPNVKKHQTALVGQQSFASHRSDVHYFNVQTKSAVFSLSCHVKYCPKGTNLKILAQHVAKHIP